MKQVVIALTLVALVAVGVTAPALAKKEKGNPVVVISTNMGDIEVELYPKDAPLTVQNFLWYVDNGFYDGLIFHRVIEKFMIQGGGFTPAMTRKAANAPIDNEANNGLSNEKYTIAMARTQAVHSATSQFFINTSDNSMSLDYKSPSSFGYCVFGKVTAGQDVVDAIAKVETGSKNGMKDVPVKPVIIKRAYREGGKTDKAKPSKKKAG
jgi:cyclophilin family peptidyl-prolyl cis-trans isomerase